MWKDRGLRLSDDFRGEVVSRLNRWFNVNMQIKGKELSHYFYTATFEDESLSQILDL